MSKGEGCLLPRADVVLLLVLLLGLQDSDVLGHEDVVHVALFVPNGSNRRLDVHPLGLGRLDEALAPSVGRLRISPSVEDDDHSGRSLQLLQHVIVRTATGTRGDDEVLAQLLEHQRTIRLSLLCGLLIGLGHCRSLLFVGR